jgi:hypothetical protein
MACQVDFKIVVDKILKDTIDMNSSKPLNSLLKVFFICFLVLENQSFSQAQQSPFIHVSDTEDSEAIFIDKSSIRRFANSDEFWFDLVKKYGSGMQKTNYKGACNATATTLQRIVIYDSTGTILEQQKYPIAWKYPENGSILRNALRIGCRLI